MRNEIRILDPDDSLLKEVKSLAKKEKRSIGKQAEYLIALQLAYQKKK